MANSNWAEGNLGDTVPDKPVDHFVDACLREALDRGIDPSELEFVGPAVIELSAAERIAEHTGDNSWLKVERFNAFMTERGKPLTSGEQALLASIINGRQ